MLKRIRELLGKRKKPSATANDVPAGTAGDAATVAEQPPVKRGPTVAHQPIAQADLDPDAVKIVRRLTRFDHRAYLVGGCVRDLLLHRKPKDFDIGTSATPRQMKRLFRNCRIIGRRFRLAHIYFQHGKIIEVATFRTRDIDEAGDANQKDLLIREDNVFGTPEEDALRRDFTINALFYDLNDGTVIDHTDGLSDLRQRLVRTIGEPAIRFREDPVRILRAIKFAARLEFAIEAQTGAALGRTRREIDKAAPPRILEEVARYGREGAARRSFELLRETKVLEVILPELARNCAGNRKAWDLLLDLLDQTDRARHGSRRPIRLGETFAVLLLPMLATRFGWKQDGTVDPPQGVDIRELVDDQLRPMSMRLRIPRREQEYCRQILATLQRMVTTKRMRGGARRSIQGRECFPDLLWILGVLAKRYSGVFASTFESWNQVQPLPATGEAADDKPRRKRRRRHGTRRGRKSAERGRAETGGQAKPGEQTKPAAEMPSPWDDDYFFAALPTLPEDQDEAASTPADPATASAGKQAQPRDSSRRTDRQHADQKTGDDAAAATPRRRRRRRRRRKKPDGSVASKDRSSQSTDEPSNRNDTDSKR